MENISINNKQAGVTLIELVLSILVLSVVVVSMSNFMSSSSKAYNVVQSSTESHNKLSYAMGRMSNELKTVDHNGTDFIINGNYSISHFEFDNVDGVTVVLDYASNNLNLSYSSVSGGTAYVLADNVSSFGFNYYQSDGVTASTGVTDIEFVEFDLTITSDGVDYHSKSRVALRNL